VAGCEDAIRVAGVPHVRALSHAPDAFLLLGEGLSGLLQRLPLVGDVAASEIVPGRAQPIAAPSCPEYRITYVLAGRLSRHGKLLVQFAVSIRGRAPRPTYAHSLH